VDLWTEVTVTRAPEFSITAEGDGADDMPKDETNLLVTGVKAAYETAGKTMPPLSYHVVSRIPYARGLGSSSAAIVAGIIAGLVLAGHRLPVWGSESLLQIAATIEGHPDNVAPVSRVCSMRVCMSHMCVCVSFVIVFVVFFLFDVPKINHTTILALFAWCYRISTT
jgi:homoserine kinase